MRRYSRLLIILPCHSVEDFPTYPRGSDAESLLANWTALWHPALVASANSKPVLQPVDDPDFETPESEADLWLAAIPSITASLIDEELETALQQSHVVRVSGVVDRNEIVKFALSKNTFAGEAAAKVDADVAEDFHALGYAFLQIQLMTRKLRYSSNLDEEAFEAALVAAAQTAIKGDAQATRTAIGKCFDILLEEKNSYYPVDPELVDLVLTAPTTLGKSLRQQLQNSQRQQRPLNVLITGEVTKELFSKFPESGTQLSQAVASGTVTLVGGLENELPDTLLDCDSVVNQFRAGLATVEKYFDVTPSIFMRRRFGLTPMTPSILTNFNYDGVIHATLDDGAFPRGSSNNISWSGADETSITAIGEVPIDASQASSFLNLSVRLGEAIDSAHQATVVFVHWPARVCQAFEDLLRISKYGNLFGNFVSLAEYFKTFYDPGFPEGFDANEYKTPFLQQAIDRQTANPISRYVQYWDRFYRIAGLRCLLTIACIKSRMTTSLVDEFRLRINELTTQIETAIDQDTPPDAIEAAISELTDQMARQLEADKTDSADAVAVINTTSFRRRVEIKTTMANSGTLKNDPPIIFCVGDQVGSHWVVEAPSVGAVALDPSALDSKNQFKRDPPVGEGLSLRNEFFELAVDPKTGGIGGILLYGSRTNLISQQLAVRTPSRTDDVANKRQPANYSTMQADSIELHNESPLAASIKSTGRMINADSVVAEFVQTARVVRGSKVIEVEVELTPRIQFAQSINHYLCSRLAWKNESARVVANAQSVRHDVYSAWFHATNFVEVIDQPNRVALLTGGLPYHRRVNRRMIDSLLMIGNEQQRKFEFGLAINESYAMQAAISRMTPVLQVPTINRETGWQFHFDAKNVIATWWDPIYNDEGRWTELRIRIRETEGRGGSLNIRCPRKISTGHRVDFSGNQQQLLELSEDATRISIEFSAFEYFQISIHWAP